MNDDGSEIVFVNMMILKNILDFSGSDDTAACCKCAVCHLVWSVNRRFRKGGRKKKTFLIINLSG